jgi:RNA polymerase sigma-70 factor (ECF subfamily)
VRVSDQTVVEDLVAETFAACWQGARRFRGARARSATAFLYTIAQRQLQGWIRRRTVEDAARRRLAYVAVLPPEDVETGWLTALDESPRAGRLLEELPERQRAAVQLRVVDEHAWPDVARRLGCTENAARLLVSRALATLRSRVAS